MRKLVLYCLLSSFLIALAHGQQEQGRPIGTVTTRGDLIVMKLDEGVLPKANLFDLARRTLRFTPDGTGYRIENLPLQWDPEFGSELTAPQVSLRNFAFPYSGKSWDSFTVGTTGTISFGTAQGGGRGRGGGGFSIGRFDQLRVAAGTLINTVPAISVFLKPRMSGTRHVKELADRAVITWNLTEPYAGIQDFTWAPTVNRFQAVLRKDGSIEMSYDQVAARDAIVGIYPTVAPAPERSLATLTDPEDSAVASHLDIRSVKATVVDGLYLKVAIETRGPVLPEGDPALAGIAYRIYFDVDKPLATRMDSADADVIWTIRGVGAQGRGGRGGGTPRYAASGPGVGPGVKVEGNTISVQGTLPAAFKGVDTFALYADVVAAGPPTAAAVDQVLPRTIALSGFRSPEVDLSAVTRQDGPFGIAYESFHYAALPSPRDLTCTVIKALGDKFDFLVYYSDFRVDNQEAGTPSTGPLGGNVTGIGHQPGRPETYCSDGRFQWQFVQPVYIGSNQAQEKAPEGVYVGRFDQLLGKVTGYNLAMSQVGHELGHRWSAFSSAKINGETIPLGPTHWARGLQAPAAFPYRRPSEASAMGGGVWQDNHDGTYTQLDDDYYVPATGWSHLDLYLMGMITPAEVPDFFILRNLVAAGRDGNGRPIFRADRVKVTINDVIAADGVRSPPSDQAQKKFNTGFVVITMPASFPSRELIERTNAIREVWVDYWATTTGHRSTMTTSVR